MAMKVCYNVVNGQVLSETRGGVRRSYVTDGLGSTLALLDSTGAKTDTFDYFPSGGVAVRTGTTPTPFQWNGGSGYYRDNSKRTHVRARNFNVNLGRWQEPDPIGFKGGDFNLYRYVKNRFMVRTDPSGLVDDCKKLSGQPQIDCWDKFCDRVEGKGFKHCSGNEWNNCVQGCRGEQNVKYCCQKDHLLNSCVCISDPVQAPCRENQHIVDGFIKRACNKLQDDNCSNRCLRTLLLTAKKWGRIPPEYVVGHFAELMLTCMGSWCASPNYHCPTYCDSDPGFVTCAYTPPNEGVGSNRCRVTLCPSLFEAGSPCNSDFNRMRTTLHELMHCCAPAGGFTTDNDQSKDAVHAAMTQAAECILKCKG